MACFSSPSSLSCIWTTNNRSGFWTKYFLFTLRHISLSNPKYKLVKWPNRVSRRLREPFTLHSHRLSVFAKHSSGQVTHLLLLRGNSDTCHSAGRIQPNILSGIPFLVVGTWGAEWADINGGGSWRLHSKTKGWGTADRRRHTLESCAHKVVRWCRQTPRHVEDYKHREVFSLKALF